MVSQRIKKKLLAMGTGGIGLLIPSEIRDELHFQAGQKVVLSSDGKSLKIEVAPIEKKKRIGTIPKSRPIPINSKPSAKTTPTTTEK